MSIVPTIFNKWWHDRLAPITVWRCELRWSMKACMTCMVHCDDYDTLITTRSFGGSDSRGASAVPFTLSVQLCNCSGSERGRCIWDHLQDGFSNNDTFQIVACTCRLPLYDGMIHLNTSTNVWSALAILTPSVPAVPNCCCSKGSAPLFLIFDIRVLWRSRLSARAPECQK